MFYRSLFFVGLVIQPPFLLGNTLPMTTGSASATIGTTQLLTDQKPQSRLNQPTHQAVKKFRNHPANTCIGSTASLSAVHDVSISSGQLTNTSPLVIDGNQQSVLLQFDLTDIPASPIDLALEVYAEQTTDLTILFAYQANTSNWSESSPIQQLPYPSALLGSALLKVDNPAYQTIYLKRNMLSAGPESLVLSVVDNNANVVIQSKESEYEPRLQINGTGDFCAQYTQNRESRLAAQPTTAQIAAPVSPPQEDTVSTVTDVNTPAIKDSYGGALSPLYAALLLLITRMRFKSFRMLVGQPPNLDGCCK